MRKIHFVLPLLLLEVGEDLSSEVCLNIGPKERQKRMRFGIIMYAFSVGMAVALVASRANRFLRLALLPFLYLAGVGVFQARAKT
jgi:predicted nucleic acid-binding Zn ribbon protein